MKTDLLHVYSSDLEESSPLELRQADRTPLHPPGKFNSRQLITYLSVDTI